MSLCESTINLLKIINDSPKGIRIDDIKKKLNLQKRRIYLPGGSTIIDFMNGLKVEGYILEKEEKYFTTEKTRRDYSLN